MNKILNSLSKVLLGVILVVIAFGVGWFFSERENFNKQNNKIKITTQNGYIENSLSQINFKEIYGLLDGTNKIYGNSLIREIEGNQTEILFKLDEIPMVVKVGENLQALPTSYNIKLMKTCCNGLDYEEVKSLPITTNLVEKNGKLSLKFSTTVNLNLVTEGVDRIIFSSEKENSFRIIKDDVKDWPSQFQAKPAPYFWINLK
jgi:hypothetical protein